MGVGIGSNAAGVADAATRLLSSIGNAFKPSTHKAVKAEAAAAKAAQEAAEEAAKVANAAAAAARQSSRFGRVMGAIGEAGNKVGNVIGEAGSKFGGLAATVVKAPFKYAFAAGKWMVEAPVSVFVLKPVKAVLNGAASVYERAPLPALAATGIAAAALGANYLSRRKSESLENETFAQGVAAQQLMQAQAAVQSTYKNTTSPQDMAAINARMAERSGAVHTAAVDAARQPVSAPEL